jgi:hypothetical protein
MLIMLGFSEISGLISEDNCISDCSSRESIK